jgi:RHS repeat-associated protein
LGVAGEIGLSSHNSLRNPGFEVLENFCTAAFARPNPVNNCRLFRCCFSCLRNCVCGSIAAMTFPFRGLRFVFAGGKRLRFYWAILIAGVVVISTAAPRVAAQDTSSDPTGGSTDTVVTTTDDPTTDTTVSDPAIDPNVTDPTAPISGTAPDSTTESTTTAAATSSSSSDYEGPIGVTGIFNGNITTGCSYDPLTHSAKRTIDDIVVPGSIGKYPLKLTRYYNSRAQFYARGGLGPGWTHEYNWLLWNAGNRVIAPSGAVYDYRCAESPIGVAERWEQRTDQYNGTFRLGDGGKVIFTNGQASSIVDPYGQTTTITRDGYGDVFRVTEPGGRNLLFTYGATDVVYGVTIRLLTKVDSYDGAGHLTDSVNYTYLAKDPGGSGAPFKMLTGVAYSDGTTASYTYQGDNVAENPPSSYKYTPLLSYASDVRYKGPMRQISYIYDVAVFPQSAPHGAILRERNYTTGYDVSRIQPPLVPNLLGNSDPPTVFTETRGDGPTRTFTYSRLRTIIDTESGGVCPDYIDEPHQQLLLSYTDFQGHTTSLDYTNGGGFVTGVTDANNHTTTYIRGSIGEVQRITHPDTRYIQYTYTVGDPHYVVSIDDENRNLTVHSRDADHQILHTEYKDSTGAILASEHFTYNGFGQVLRHQLKNGNYVHYQYDTRGLLTAKTNPTSIDVPGGAFTWAPKTTYTYYTSGPWTDRVLTETLPANSSGYQASETYEYDRSASNAAVAGRGQVTRITHADGWSKSFDYDAYGNKLWEKNELLQQTTYTYDVYNRLLTATRVMSPNETTTYSYAPTNGTSTSSLVHTTSNPDTVRSPSGILTTNDYDQNFRKISVTEPLGIITRFAYDNVGNPTTVTDPLNHVTSTTYDTRDRKRTVTRAYGTSSAQMTTYTYDFANNLTRIDQPDGSWETKVYDGLNRVTLDTVPRINNADTIVTQFVYFQSGMVQKVTDGNGHWTQFLYDESNRRTQMDQQGGSQRTWTWDDAGNLASRTTVGGKIQTFTYDNRNRKKTMVWSNSAEWQFFAYDAASRLATAMNGTGAWNTNIISTVTRTYDAAGRLTLDRQAVAGLATKDVNYQYDEDGKMSRMYVTGAGYDYTFTYDGAGRFWKIFTTGSGTPDYMYTYDDASNETQRFSYANLMAQNYSRDALNRMYSRSLTRGGTTLANEIYGYDAMNRITSVNRESANDDTFGYYMDGELKTANYAGAGAYSGTYNLDKAGNRTSVAYSSGTVTYTPNVINQYTAAENSGLTNGSEHEISAAWGANYTYINDGQLSLVSVPGGASTQLYHDALGRVAKRLFNGTQLRYVVSDGEREILELDSTGAITARNVYGKGIDEILMRADIVSGFTYYYQQDHEGSITHLTSATGAFLEKYRYDAFGLPTYYNGNGAQISASAYANPYLFTARRKLTWDTYEYRARAYNAELGRFMSEDPSLFDAGDYNLFRYCNNDPLDLTDPMGLAPVGVDAETDSYAQQAGLLNNEFSKERYASYSLGKQMRMMFQQPESTTAVWKDNKTQLKSLSPTRTNDDRGGVAPVLDSSKTTLVDTHNHPSEDIHPRTTNSYLSLTDIAYGVVSGNTQQVITPSGAQDRYRPSDKLTWEKRWNEGGVIERQRADGTWAPVPGARDDVAYGIVKGMAEGRQSRRLQSREEQRTHLFFIQIVH